MDDRSVYRRLYPIWKNRLATGLKRRRLERASKLALGGRLFDPQWLAGKRILDLGCANGRDFLQFLAGTPGLELYGLDLAPPLAA